MNYDELNVYLEGLVADESDWLAGLANASALLYGTLEGVNWAGFYLYKGGQLVLGPFQGKPACVRIDITNGVCGAAARAGVPLIVKDVHKFPGHIACDSASRSEIVLPMISRGRLLGVMDVDSPELARFSKEDLRGLERFVTILMESLTWPQKFE